jgi:hypothetical protein
VTHQILKITVLVAIAVLISAVPSVSDSQNASPGQRIGERLYVGEIEMGVPSYRGGKAFHFTLLNGSGGFAACGRGPGARPNWYYVPRCSANDQVCIAANDGLWQLLISAKLSRLPVSAHAPNCKVDVLHLW